MWERACSPKLGGWHARSSWYDTRQRSPAGRWTSIAKGEWIEVTRNGLAVRLHYPIPLDAALRKDLHELGAVASDGSDAVSEEQLKRLFRVFKANYGAWLRYRCEEPLVADALQAIAFVAQDGDAQAAASEIVNWHRALPGRLRVHYTPGNHYSILAGQNLERLLEQLHRELASLP